MTLVYPYRIDHNDGQIVVVSPFYKGNPTQARAQMSRNERSPTPDELVSIVYASILDEAGSMKMGPLFEHAIGKTLLSTDSGNYQLNSSSQRKLATLQHRGWTIDEVRTLTSTMSQSYFSAQVNLVSGCLTLNYQHTPLTLGAMPRVLACPPIPMARNSD